jgi:hypothetical protein
MTDLHTKVEKYQTNAAQCEAWAGPLLANSPTGKSANLCPALIRKIFRLTRRANHLYGFARLARKRGGSRSSRTSGGMRWTRQRRRAEAIAGRVFIGLVSDLPARRRTMQVADGEVVWS